jgi:miniconductance mechanosensitive channel
MFKHLEQWSVNWLNSIGFDNTYAEIITDYLFFIAIIILSLVSFFITRKVLIKVLQNITKKSKTKWDDVLMEKRFFNKLSYLVPAYLVYIFTPLALNLYPVAINTVQTLLTIYMVLVVIMAINSFLNAVGSIYEDFTISQSKPIKGYIQIVKIILFIVGAIVIIAHLFNKNPLGLLGGLGAFSAVLLLVFRDPILGFVGGIQLSANNMLKPGDWISMPKFDADGIVTDVALTTVKIQNWDKSISTIPTYSLIEDSFKNWRGMQESGGRRIKRSINIDMKSVKFCSGEMLEKFKRIHYLKDYVETKQNELDEFNRMNDIDESVIVNGRRQTNLGVFRAYLNGYLRNHPYIHDDMTFIVRQLQPTEKGIPMEIYVFSKLQEWDLYENLQSDIFDHLLAVVHEFDLQVYQNPSGNDFQRILIPGA